MYIIRGSQMSLSSFLQGGLRELSCARWLAVRMAVYSVPLTLGMVSRMESVRSRAGKRYWR